MKKILMGVMVFFAMAGIASAAGSKTVPVDTYGGYVLSTDWTNSGVTTFDSAAVFDWINTDGNLLLEGAVQISQDVTANAFFGDISNCTGGGGSAEAAGSNYYIQYYADGVLGGESSFQYNPASNLMTLAGDLSQNGTQTIIGLAKLDFTSTGDDDGVADIGFDGSKVQTLDATGLRSLTISGDMTATGAGAYGATYINTVINGKLYTIEAKQVVAS